MQSSCISDLSGEPFNYNAAPETTTRRNESGALIVA